MTYQEYIKVRHLVDAMEDLFSAHRADQAPFLALRVEDAAIFRMPARRPEKGLPIVPGGVDKAESPPVALLISIGKASNRLTTTINEREDHCSKAGTPVHIGLAEKAKPLLKKAEGVLEEALARGPGYPEPLHQSC